MPAFLLLLLFSSALSSSIPPSCHFSVIGAGIGGIYSAWRLAIDTATIPPQQICIFEAKARPGGRILTVTDAVPAFRNFTVDLGAYRFDRVAHRHMRLLVENVLGVQTLCYTDPLQTGNAECGSAVRPIVGARGVIFGLTANGTNADTSLSTFRNRIPYRIPPRFQWGPQKPLDAPRDPYQLLLGPFAIVQEIAQRWRELTTAPTYATAMRIADEIIADLRRGSYRDIPYADISLLQMAVREGFKPEELALFFDTSVFIDEQFYTRVSVLQLGSIFVRIEALARDRSIREPRSAVTPVAERNGIPRRVGMGRILDIMLNQLVASGVNVFYNSKVISIRRVHEGESQLVVEFAGGSSVLTENIIANIGKPDLIALGVGSEPLRSSSEDFRRAVERNYVVGLSKTYCFWEDAWWLTKLKTSFGQSRTADENIYSLRYHDGDVSCDDRQTFRNCRGALLVSYSAGDPSGACSAIHAHVHNELGYTPLTNTDNVRKYIPGNMTGVEKLYFDDLLKQLRRFHRTSLKQMGFDANEAIPPPVGCVLGDWSDVGIHFQMGPGTGDLNVYKLYTQPVKDLNISLVNEAWGYDQGWAEGSLHSAERALFHQYGLPRPSWMDEPFHNSIIVKFNLGES